LGADLPAQLLGDDLRILGDLRLGQEADRRDRGRRADQLAREDQRREAQRGRPGQASSYRSVPSL
jgi:hypothetical protein